MDSLGLRRTRKDSEGLGRTHRVGEARPEIMRQSAAISGNHRVGEARPEVMARAAAAADEHTQLAAAVRAQHLHTGGGACN